MKKRMKMLTSVVLTVPLLLTVTPTVQASGLDKLYDKERYEYYSPSDIQNHWAEENLENFIKADLLVGYKENDEILAKPNREISRAEFVAFLVRALDLKQEGNPKKFDDVKTNHWFYEPISIASSLGYVGGMTETTYEPNRPIKRAEMASILVRAYKDTVPLNQSKKVFSDTHSHWAKEVIEEATKGGMIGGYPDGNFKPESKATRAEAVAMIERGMFKENTILPTNEELKTIATQNEISQIDMAKEKDYEQLCYLSKTYGTAYYGNKNVKECIKFLEKTKPTGNFEVKILEEPEATVVSKANKFAKVTVNTKYEITYKKNEEEYKKEFDKNELYYLKNIEGSWKIYDAKKQSMQENLNSMIKELYFKTEAKNFINLKNNFEQTYQKELGIMRKKKEEKYNENIKTTVDFDMSNMGNVAKEIKKLVSNLSFVYDKNNEPDIEKNYFKFIINHMQDKVIDFEAYETKEEVAYASMDIYNKYLYLKRDEYGQFQRTINPNYSGPERLETTNNASNWLEVSEEDAEEIIKTYYTHVSDSIQSTSVDVEQIEHNSPFGVETAHKLKVELSDSEIKETLKYLANKAKNDELLLQVIAENIANYYTYALEGAVYVDPKEEELKDKAKARKRVIEFFENIDDYINDYQFENGFLLEAVIANDLSIVQRDIEFSVYNKVYKDKNAYVFKDSRIKNNNETVGNWYYEQQYENEEYEMTDKIIWKDQYVTTKQNLNGVEKTKTTHELSQDTNTDWGEYVNDSSFDLNIEHTREEGGNNVKNNITFSVPTEKENEEISFQISSELAYGENLETLEGTQNFEFYYNSEDNNFFKAIMKNELATTFTANLKYPTIDATNRVDMGKITKAEYDKLNQDIETGWNEEMSRNQYLFEDINKAIEEENKESNTLTKLMELKANVSNSSLLDEYVDKEGKESLHKYNLRFGPMHFLKR